MNSGTHNADTLLEDDELERNVRLFLRHSGHRPVQAVTVKAKNGVVILSGTVPSYFVRQLAIACARRVAGVRTIVDQINATLRR
jgi:osmotically-inducible protein OsmY